MPTISERFVDYKSIKFSALRRRAGEKKKGDYVDAIAAFDIETSRISEIDQSIMYIWQFCIDWPDGRDLIIIGRTWDEFKHMMHNLQHRLGWNKLAVFVHNLSYEFQFLSGIYPFTDEEVFCLESRSILTARMYGNFEFRCSYKLFNMPLANVTEKYAPDYHKKSGAAFGYDDRRFSDTELTRKQLLYCIYDVWGLCKAIRAIMKLFDDSLYSLPHTSTGYVRREVKQLMRPYYHQLKDAFPDMELYQMLRYAFRGGNTHASRYYAGSIIENVKSVDISSSYPSQQCLKKYPVTPFKRSYDTRTAYIHQCIDRGRACLIHAKLTNLELSDRFIHIPYLPTAKCISSYNYRVDNGRILAADMVEICVTDIDFGIIEKQYTFDIEILGLWLSWYDYLPAPIREINQKYFNAKTELKNVKGQDLYYFKSKNLLNSIYGMSVMNPVRFPILFNEGAYTLDISVSAESLLQRAARQPYCLYQWGVWTTAHARAALQYGIDLCGDGIIYVDTDSCKFIGNPDFTAYNKQMMLASESAGCAANDKRGVRHFMGVYEDDGSYKRFVTLGAKKYAYEDDNENVHITVAGVPKKEGAAELAAAGGLEMFKAGFTFAAGKLEAVYNDGCIKGVEIDGRKIDITKNVCLRPTQYTLDITDEYNAVLKESAKYLRKVIYSCKNSLLTNGRQF